MSRQTNEGLINNASIALKRITTNPIMESDIILARVLNIQRSKLFCEYKTECPADKQALFLKHLKRRQTGIPLAYIFGEKEFYGRMFKVNSSVLIPRPESELFIGEIKKFAGQKRAFSLLEIGTGSGALAVTIAKDFPEMDITATDVDDKALAIAKLNAQKYKTNNISFIKSDLLTNLKNKHFEIIIANLPYVKIRELKNLSSRNTIGLSYEPVLSLDGGRDGLKIYNRLFKQIKSPYSKLILLEIDPRLTKAIKKIIENYLPQYSISFIKDLAGHNRLVKLFRN